MKTDIEPQSTASKPNGVAGGDYLNRLVSVFRGMRNRAIWWWHENRRRRKCCGLYEWMVRHHGKPEYGCGAWSWRVNGVLCSIWIEVSRLKIYEDGGKSTICYELHSRFDNSAAREHIDNLSANVGSDLSCPTGDSPSTQRENGQD